MQPQTVLVTATGRDRVGVTASLLSALAAYDVEVRDVEQVVIRGRLMLAVLLDLRGEVGALRTAITHAAEALGMDSQVTMADTPGPPGTAGADDAAPPKSPLEVGSHVMVLGRPMRPGALGHVAQQIAELGASIESVTRLAAEPAIALDLRVRGVPTADLRTALAQAADATGLDIGVEAAGLQRRAKRLVVLDVDSTLIADEAIDVLAERAGLGAEIGRITAEAMAGELDFATALRQRIARLAGMPLADVLAVRDALQLTPGAATFVRTLHRLGYHVGVVSGGFTIFTDRFVAELGLDFAAANELEVSDGRLTGEVRGPVIDRAGKADALRRFAAAFGVPLAQTVAVGDGANDIDMLKTAGLGVAFNAKAALRAAADGSITQPHLDAVLFMLGISGEEITEALQPS